MFLRLSARLIPRLSVAVAFSRLLPMRVWVCTVVLAGRPPVTPLAPSLYASRPVCHHWTTTNFCYSSSVDLLSPRKRFTSWPTTTLLPGVRTLSPRSAVLALPWLCPLPSMLSRPVSRTATSRTPSLASRSSPRCLRTRALPASSRVWPPSCWWQVLSWSSASGWHRLWFPLSARLYRDHVL